MNVGRVVVVELCRLGGLVCSRSLMDAFNRAYRDLDVRVICGSIAEELFQSCCEWGEACAGQL